MKIEELKEYIHSDWSETAECRNDKYYFVRTDADKLEDVFAEIKHQLEVPDDLKGSIKRLDLGSYGLGSNKRKGFTGFFLLKNLWICILGQRMEGSRRTLSCIGKTHGII